MYFLAKQYGVDWHYSSVATSCLPRKRVLVKNVGYRDESVASHINR